MMHLLERIAAAFNDAGVPLMVLKGAALNLTIHEDPGERAMLDLDLLVKPQDSERARGLLEHVVGTGLPSPRGEGSVRSPRTSRAGLTDGGERRWSERHRTCVGGSR